MLHRLNTKKDVLNWLYAIGDGVGLPYKAQEHLEPFFSFRLQDEPNSVSRFEMVNQTTGDVLACEETPHFAPTMRRVQDHFEPELDDFELKFDLPAVVFAHYESGFDRTGDFELAFFDIRSLDTLEIPQRFSARGRMHGVISFVTADDLGISTEELNLLHTWFNEATEADVRRALSEHYRRDFKTDEALAPYLRSYQREFGFFFVFLQGKDFEALQAFEARQAAQRRPRETQMAQTPLSD